MCDVLSASGSMRAERVGVFGRRARSAAAVLLAAVSLGGCGSGGDHQSGAAPSAAPSSGEDRRVTFAAYRQCLEEHGMPTPTARPDGGAPRATRTPGEPRPTRDPNQPRPTRDPAQAALFDAARQACASLRPAGGLRPGGLQSEARLGFGRCMREHGVELPRPTAPPPGIEPSGEPTAARGGMLAGLDRNDPKVSAALDACRELLIRNSSATPGPSATPG
jgi:hypothetical protein